MIKRIGLISGLFILLWACSERPKSTFTHNPKRIIDTAGIQIEVFDFENFKPFLSQKDDRIHIINFWATWCIPCVAELPYFEQIEQAFPDIDLTLVSLDFPSLLEKNLIPFIQKNELKSTVIVLDEPDGNTWIPQIDKNWSGAIPATIIYKNDKSNFYEQSFTFEELKNEIDSFDN